jgi:hypothetical protein
MSVNPRENRLTEITAAVLDRVDSLAKTVVEDLLASGRATDASQIQPDTNGGSPASERCDMALSAVRRLNARRVEIRTQLTTPKGRFVDMEIWLVPRAVMAREDELDRLLRGRVLVDLYAVTVQALRTSRPRADASRQRALPLCRDGSWRSADSEIVRLARTRRSAVTRGL